MAKLSDLLDKGGDHVHSVTLRADGSVDVEADGAVPTLHFQDMNDAVDNLDGVLEITCPEDSNQDDT